MDKLFLILARPYLFALVIRIEINSIDIVVDKSFRCNRFDFPWASLWFRPHRVSAHFTTFFTCLVRSAFFAPSRARLLYLRHVLKGFSGSSSGTRLSLVFVRARGKKL